jgi:hypothetical protein
VEEIRVRARGAHGGTQHTIWIAGRAVQSAAQEPPTR